MYSIFWLLFHHDGEAYSWKLKAFLLLFCVEKERKGSVENNMLNTNRCFVQERWKGASAERKVPPLWGAPGQGGPERRPHCVPLAWLLLQRRNRWYIVIVLVLSSSSAMLSADVLSSILHVFSMHKFEEWGRHVHTYLTFTKIANFFCLLTLLMKKFELFFATHNTP